MSGNILGLVVAVLITCLEFGFGQNVVTLGSYQINRNSYDVEIRDTLAFVAQDGGLLILNVENPSDITQVANLAIPSHARHITLADTIAYVLADDGLHVVSISLPSNPIEMAYQNLADGYRNEMALYDHYLVGGGPGLFVVDIQNPLAPVVRGSVETESSIGGVAIRDHYAVVALSAMFGGILIVDLSDPTNPQAVGSANTNDWAHGVTVFGNYAALAVDFDGVQIFDISTPTLPQAVSELHFEDAITNSIASAGDYVYACGQNERLHIFNVEDPANPYSVGVSTYSLDGTEVAVDSSGMIAYTVDDMWLHIYDCSEALPVGEFSAPYLSREISLLAYPNPFNPTTNLSFSVAHESEVQLNIFDVNGRLVREVVRGSFAPGQHTANWSCVECASGIYFATLNAGKFTASQKLLLLK